MKYEIGQKLLFLNTDRCVILAICKDEYTVRFIDEKAEEYAEYPIPSDWLDNSEKYRPYTPLDDILD